MRLGHGHILGAAAEVSGLVSVKPRGPVVIQACGLLLVTDEGNGGPPNKI